MAREWTASIVICHSKSYAITGGQSLPWISFKDTYRWSSLAALGILPWVILPTPEFISTDYCFRSHYFQGCFRSRAWFKICNPSVVENSQNGQKWFPRKTEIHANRQCPLRKLDGVVIDIRKMIIVGGSHDYCQKLGKCPMFLRSTY